MRKVKATVPAFTIMEVTISMLVAAIVVAMTYSAYGIITKSWLGFTDKNQQMGIVLRLDELLRRDFEKAAFVEQEQGGITIYGEGHPVYYQMEPEQVVRISSITDTFRLKATALQGYFEGKAINEVVEADGQAAMLGAENNYEGFGKQLIDEISFSINLQNTMVPFHYKKKYSAESLMAIKP